MKKPTLGITLGDPDGIGPELVFKALRDKKIRKLANWKLYGSASNKPVGPKRSGLISLTALEHAVADLKNKKIVGLVTAPISKERIQKTGFKFPGHTEFLAHEFKSKKTVMMFVSPKLKVSLVTIHVPLKKVASLLSVKNILDTITLTHQSLKKYFCVKNPRIAVCGLNPHAGEKGLFGREEQKIIAPAIRQAQKKKMNVLGPYPADSIFYQAANGRFDAVVAMYHDQGLIPIKTLDFHNGVNMTLGIPIIRTSPDQGCAFDIAGKNIANPSSMKAAMKLVVEVWKNR